MSASSHNHNLPYGGIDVVADLKSRFSQNIFADISTGGQAAVLIDKDALPEIAKFLRNNNQCLFTMLVDICGADYPERDQRFEVIYHLLSVQHNMRLRLKIAIGEEEFVPSLSDIWSSAGWYERECWDMYGIFFSGHSDLRRILTDYGFTGHPLRKDFPLTGYVELRYDDEAQRVVSEPVSLQQEFRDFDFLSPWEGDYRQTSQILPSQILPGDEKAEKED